MRRAHLAALLLILVSLQILQAHAAAQYIGNRNTKVYHQSTCRYVDEINPENRVVFNYPENATAAGYQPCKVCNPPVPEYQILPVILVPMTIVIMALREYGWKRK